MNKRPCVYILASRKHGTLYIGFTSKYGVYRLVYVERRETIEAAITR